MERSWLKALRKQERYSQGALAVAVGVSRTTIQWWESGDRAPSREHMLSLARILGTAVLEGFVNEQPQSEAKKSA